MQKLERKNANIGPHSHSFSLNHQFVRKSARLRKKHLALCIYSQFQHFDGSHHAIYSFIVDEAHHNFFSLAQFFLGDIEIFRPLFACFIFAIYFTWQNDRQFEHTQKAREKK